MLGVPEFLGHPLLKGNTFYATAASDLFVAWTPGDVWSFQRVHHPLPNVDITISPTARFGGYPPVQTPEGVVVGDDTTHRFLTTLLGHAKQKWHIHPNNSLGIPATSEGAIFIGFGGKSATKGIVALESVNGKPIWT